MTSSVPDTQSARPRRSRLQSMAVLVMVCLAIVFVARTIGPQTLGEQARRMFERQLAEHYTQWDVSIGRGVYLPGVGFQFERIAFAPLSDERPRTSQQSITGAILLGWNRSPVVVLDSMTVIADIDAKKLLDKRSPMTTRQVVIEGVHADMRLESDGTVSLKGLLPLPKLGPVCPRIDLRDVILNVAVEEKLSNDGSAVRAGGVDDVVGMSEPERPIQFRWSEIVIENLSEVAAVRDGERKFTIQGDSDLCGRCEVNVSQVLRDEEVIRTVASANVASLRLNNSVVDRFRTWLPKGPPAGAQFDVLGDLSITFEMGDAGASQVPAATQSVYAAPASHPTNGVNAIPGVNRVPSVNAVKNGGLSGAGLTGAANRGGNTGTFDYVIDYVVRNGRYTDRRLPSPIEDCSGRVKITPTKIELFPMQATLGQALVRAQGTAEMQVALNAPEPIRSASVYTANYSTPIGLPDDALTIPICDSSLVARLWNCDITVSAENLYLNEGFRPLMPEKTALLFDRFQPSGQIDFVTRWFNPQPLAKKPWSVEANVNCEGVGVQFDKFPYPVESLTGLIRISNGRVDSRRLTGNAGGRPIHCEFNVPMKLRPDDRVSPAKSVVIRSDGAIPIDSALVSALTPRESSVAGDGTTGSASTGESKLESFIRSLHPRGAIELASASIQTDAAGVTSRQFDLRVIGGTLRYDQFAYPLYNVAGRVQVKDDLVRMIGFTANNAGAAKIACDGLYQMSSDPMATELNMRFRVADIAMDHSLRVSLPESSRNIWEALSPAGTLDQLDVQIQRTGTRPIVLSLNAAHQSELRAKPNILSIRPKAVPYRLDIVSGSVDYSDGQVKITNLRGRHDASRLIADGVCRPDSTGRWLLTLDLHSGCRLIPDEELIAALPEQMSWAMRGLDLRGPLGLRGVTNILLPESELDSPAIDWDLALQLEGNRIADVGPVHSLRGEIMIRGVKDGELLRAGGDLAIDSLHAYGFQVTSLRGPFSILGDELRLGTFSTGLDPITGVPLIGTAESRLGGAVNPDKSGRQAPIVGRMFEGQLNVSGIVALSTGDFDVGASMENGQLATILAEMGQTRSGITGRFDMNSRLDGRLGDSDLLKGSGTARVSGANMYELPLLVQVLNLLRITPTEDVAFTDGETEFAIFGEDINFNRLSMWGDLVALDGSGTLSRLEHLDLSFNTKVSPQNLFSKVISPLRDNSYTFWTIEVDGPLSAPTIQRHALGGVSQTLESWFPGMVRSTTADTSAVNR
ncbi:hypothetical protein FHS27_003333 [Rhodopirellula rubra]|uniref:AsmA-like C-terminal domain-containing protein n=1 Tax=Aporhodopirellula rubra TaxID=980271 RepID=A0A7W5E0M1_9BACT|nr:hypothetical protein [Aporhodopirellula rubra]MBB3207508.1 hypothetical protein [Aporhodopirellula rubra]